jgi:hypothetical protein
LEHVLGARAADIEYMPLFLDLFDLILAAVPMRACKAAVKLFQRREILA